MHWRSLRDLDARNRYRTDKLGRCEVNRHDYAAGYEFHFGPLRKFDFVFWEIGIDRGDSLRMWSDYFPAATVVGIDLNPPTLPDWKCPPRVNVRLGDVNDAAFLRAVALEFPPGVVLDDGSHKAGDLRAAFAALWPLTKILYAVEDVGTQYPSFRGGEFLDAEPFPVVAHDAADRLARLEACGFSRVCFESGQIYLYK